MKKIRDKVKGLSISLDKSTKLKELNPIIDKFKKETDKSKFPPVDYEKPPHY